mmetsp:Transcript_8120/g.29486  ORF Transcript_8120/g.29486 Transcript_8120/m.29486 type:complete len:200 (+) Transcript_8120:184-783(+)
MANSPRTSRCSLAPCNQRNYLTVWLRSCRGLLPSSKISPLSTTATDIPMAPRKSTFVSKHATCRLQRRHCRPDLNRALRTIVPSSPPTARSSPSPRPFNRNGTTTQRTSTPSPPTLPSPMVAARWTPPESWLLACRPMRPVSSMRCCVPLCLMRLTCNSLMFLLTRFRSRVGWPRAVALWPLSTTCQDRCLVRECLLED